MIFGRPSHKTLVNVDHHSKLVELTSHLMYVSDRRVFATLEYDDTSLILHILVRVCVWKGRGL